MNFLAIIPAPYRILAMVLAALALLAFGYMQGVEAEEGRRAKQDLEAERAGVRLGAARARVTERVELKYAPQLTQVRTITKTIIKEVDRYVPVSDCPLSPGFRVFHDAAAEGRIPDPASVAHAAAVTAREAATTVAENYGSCRENAKRLEGLQEWVREQRRLNDAKIPATANGGTPPADPSP